MRNNPFITILLLFCIEIAFFNFLAYINYMPINGDLMFTVLCFFVPACSLLLSLYMDEKSSYKKSFVYLTVFLVILSLIVYLLLSYLSALGKAYQH